MNKQFLRIIDWLRKDWEFKFIIGLGLFTLVCVGLLLWEVAHGSAA